MSEEWLPAYEWIDPATGATRRASRAHRRAGIWELASNDETAWRAYSQQDPDLTAEEYWVRMLPASVLDKICFLIGPMNRQDHQIASVRTAMAAEEARWQAILWELYEVQQQHPWASPEFQQRLDQLVPQSWNCRPFGKEHQCEMFGICHKHEGWQDPLGSGRYQPRLPHHQAELDQAVARGLLPAEATEAEEEPE